MLIFTAASCKKDIVSSFLPATLDFVSPIKWVTISPVRRVELSFRVMDAFTPNRSLEIFSYKKSDCSRLYHRYSICILTQYASFILF